MYPIMYFLPAYPYFFVLCYPARSYPRQTDSSVLTSPEKAYNKKTVSDHHGLCRKVRGKKATGSREVAALGHVWVGGAAEASHTCVPSGGLGPKIPRSSGAHHPTIACVDPSLGEQRNSPPKSWVDSLLDSRSLAHSETIKFHFPTDSWNELLNQK